MRGEINVEKVMAEAWRREHRNWIRRIEAIEEQEALRWWRRAETEAEKQEVIAMYGPALSRYSERKKQQHLTY